MHIFKKIVCGGTFDLLHPGHKEFLKQVFEKGERVVIGLTSDKYISEHKPNKNISPFEIRKKILEKFLQETGVEERVKVIPIDTMYGPLLDFNFQVDALAVTFHSKDNAERINIEREKKGLKSLEIVQIPLVKDEQGEVVSSSRIRQNLLLPPTLRHLLQDAWGEILNDIPVNLELNKIITVGDVTTGKFIEKGIFPKLMIIDNKVERKEKKFPYEIPSNYRIVKLKNSSSTVSKVLSNAIKNAFNTNRMAIIVEGEEDLAVLPVLLFAPVGFSVFYGQLRLGLVHIIITKKIKEKAKDILDQFQIV